MHMPPALAAVPCLLAVALAGCSDGGAGAEDPLKATEDTGVLQGVVVDDAIRPLAGAAIAVRGSGGEWTAATGPEGTFRLGGLPPGSYVVAAAKAFYIAQEQTVEVRAAIDDPPFVRFQLQFEASLVPYSSLYKYEGFHECGFNFVRVCSNVNILTGIVVCSYDPPGAPCFNVTGDTSVFFQDVEGGPTFIQAELVWEPTSEPGRALGLYVGGGNLSELQQGTASTYNFTAGESPLMVRITNHEGENAWCVRTTDCPYPDTLNQSRIGTERTLLGQVDAGPTYPNPVGPNPACDEVAGRCTTGFSAQQPFTMFTTVFYGYEPPDEWRFALTSEVPPPPPR